LSSLFLSYFSFPFSSFLLFFVFPFSFLFLFSLLFFLSFLCLPFFPLSSLFSFSPFHIPPFSSIADKMDRQTPQQPGVFPTLPPMSTQMPPPVLSSSAAASSAQPISTPQVNSSQHPSGIIPTLQSVTVSCCIIVVFTYLHISCCLNFLIDLSFLIIYIYYSVPFSGDRCRNIVATVNLECRLDLKTIALHARNAEYNPKVCVFSLSICPLLYHVSW
jgi:hypothetical protein